MAYVVQIDASLLNIDFIKDPVVANSQFALRSPTQSLVRKRLDASPISSIFRETFR